MKIITNHQYRNLIYGYELSDKEKEDFDYLGDDITMHDFIRYKGFVYDPSEFMRAPDSFTGWDGLHSDTFFSGILIKYSSDGEQCKLATVYS